MKSFLIRVFHLFIDFLGVLFHKYARNKPNKNDVENCYLKEEDKDGNYFKHEDK